ncbi:hypothetical protein [Ottowia thiooxydans]|uniref:hypothetical protein n=1 Tax=Ottowia thiooxydans TaxID=219182 RepID=UPI0003F865CA|nr:hypothetical protein [Ottowia thiooxydans]
MNVDAAVLQLQLQFEDLLTWVRSAPGADLQVVLSLPVGAGALARDVLRHVPPHPLEIEQAIEVVEDAVMPLRAQLPASLQLVCADPLLRGLAAAALGGRGESVTDELNVAELPSAPIWWDVEAVEQVFNRLVARSEGRPAAQDNLSVDGASAARLVIVREMLHHWGLNGLLLSV